MQIERFEARKREHILQSLDLAHQASGLNGLDRVRLIHEALPDLNFEDINVATACLGKKLATPFYVAGMTAGHPDAVLLNRRIASLCQKRGWAMGIGSQRRQLEEFQNGSSEGIDQWKRLREEAPDLVLFANVGIAQLIPARIEHLKALVESISAQALVVHLNSLQEVIQKEGTPQFKGGFAALKKCCEELRTPVIVKETGCGFSPDTLTRLATLQLGGVDVSGLGGTHWGRIEGARAGSNSLEAQVSATFANWGESTVSSVISAKETLPQSIQIWASGGVRSGLDAAKLIAIGATRVGYAQPVLKAALEGEAKLDQWMQIQEYELRVALFCTGSASCENLRGKERIWTIAN